MNRKGLIKGQSFMFSFIIQSVFTAILAGANRGVSSNPTSPDLSFSSVSSATSVEKINAFKGTALPPGLNLLYVTLR